MTTPDPIVSATLAQLYLAQGHLGRAATVLDRVLAERPHDGQALVLRERLAAHSKATLVCEPDGETLVLNWQGVPEAADVHLVFAAFIGKAHPVRVRVTSRRCKTAFGQWRCRKPMQPGSAVCSLVALAGDDIHVIAVAQPSSWE